MKDVKSNKTKIKVLVIPSDRTGVSYFRSTNPHIALENKYPDNFSVDIDYEARLDDVSWMKKYDIVHYHRNLGRFEDMPAVLDKLDEMGIITIMDIDDFWAPGIHHPAYHLIKNQKLDEKILDAVRIARNITTTTPLFAEMISKYNKNVYVVPNAIDPKEKQFTPKPEKSEKLRIGWLGGSSHLNDLQILEGVVSKLRNDNLLDKVQFVLCGFDTKGTTTEINPQTGQYETVPVKPKQTVWYEYEKIFTDNYSIVSPEYKKHLMKFTTEEFKGIEKESYRRVWTKSISTYAMNYNLFDVSLAPLAEHDFNKAKSQLKIIEAGFHNKAIIAQNFGPYKIDIKNAIQYGGGFDMEANGILIDTVKNHKDWYASIKKLIQNPELISSLQKNLHNTVKDTYSMNKVSDTRKEVYEKLISNKK